MASLLRASRLSLIALLSAGACACSVPTAELDGGVSEGGGAPAGWIEIESEPSLSLTYGESAVIRIRYFEAEGEAGVGVQLQFAFQGRAHDSSLESLSATTSEEGRASTTLYAATSAAAYRLRVSSARAAPVYIDVAIDDAGFGTLQVELPYEGERSVRARRLDLFASRSCARPDLPTTGDRSETLSDGVESFTFATLPVSESYALRVLGLSESGETLASVCVDGLEVRPEETTRVRAPLLDLPLLYEGDYELSLHLRASGTAEAAAATVSAAALGPSSAVGGDGAFLLDALAEELLALGATTASESLASERAGGLDALMDERLIVAAAGPSYAAAALNLELREGLSRLDLVAHLRWSSSGAVLLFEGAQVQGELETSLPISVAALGASREPLIVLRYEEGDRVLLDELAFSATLGTLSVAALDARAAARGLIPAGDPGGGGSIVRERLGCLELGLLVEERSELATACDAACIEATCGRATAALWAAAETALLELDGERSQITLGGELAGVDEVGDRRLDRFDANALSGEWGGFLSTETDPLEADLGALRVDTGSP